MQICIQKIMYSYSTITIEVRTMHSNISDEDLRVFTSGFQAVRPYGRIGSSS